MDNGAGNERTCGPQWRRAQRSTLGARQGASRGRTVRAQLAAMEEGAEIDPRSLETETSVEWDILAAMEEGAEIDPRSVRRRLQ